MALMKLSQPMGAFSGAHWPAHALLVTNRLAVSSGRTLRVRCSAAPEDRLVAVRFTVPFKAKFGEKLRVVGSHESVGCWDVDSAPTMQWQEGDQWVAAVVVPEGTSIEYKLVYESHSGAQWEATANRTVVAEASGAVAGAPSGTAGVLDVTCRFNDEAVVVVPRALSLDALQGLLPKEVVLLPLTAPAAQAVNAAPAAEELAVAAAPSMQDEERVCDALPVEADAAVAAVPPVGEAVAVGTAVLEPEAMVMHPLEEELMQQEDQQQQQQEALATSTAVKEALQQQQEALAAAAAAKKALKQQQEALATATAAKQALQQQQEAFAAAAAAEAAVQQQQEALLAAAAAEAAVQQQQEALVAAAAAEEAVQQQQEALAAAAAAEEALQKQQEAALESVLAPAPAAATDSSWTQDIESWAAAATANSMVLADDVDSWALLTDELDETWDHVWANTEQEQQPELTHAYAAAEQQLAAAAEAEAAAIEAAEAAAAEAAAAEAAAAEAAAAEAAAAEAAAASVVEKAVLDMEEAVAEMEQAVEELEREIEEVLPEEELVGGRRIQISSGLAKAGKTAAAVALGVGALAGLGAMAVDVTDAAFAAAVMAAVVASDTPTTKTSKRMITIKEVNEAGEEVEVMREVEVVEPLNEQERAQARAKSSGTPGLMIAAALFVAADVVKDVAKASTATRPDNATTSSGEPEPDTPSARLARRRRRQVQLEATQLQQAAAREAADAAASGGRPGLLGLPRFGSGAAAEQPPPPGAKAVNGKAANEVAVNSSSWGLPLMSARGPPPPLPVEHDAGKSEKGGLLGKLLRSAAKPSSSSPPSSGSSQAGTGGRRPPSPPPKAYNGKYPRPVDKLSARQRQR